MELDHLKLQWNKRTTDLNKKNMEQLQSILKSKASGMLLDIKKRYEATISYVFVGTIAGLLLSGFIPWIAGKEGPVYSLPTTVNYALNALVFVLIGFTIIFFYWKKYTSLQTNISGKDVKTTLMEYVLRLRRSLRQEIAFVVSLTLGWFVVARMHSQFAGNGDFWNIFSVDIFIAIILLFTLSGGYLFYKISQYRKCIKELQGYLTEYEELNI